MPLEVGGEIKVNKVTKCAARWPKPRQQHDKRGPERQQHSSSDHHDDEEGRGMQEEDASTYEGGRAYFFFLFLSFFCTQIARIKTKTRAHAHLHLPFDAGTCQFPNKTGPSVADRASTRQRSLPDQSLSLCSILSTALEAIC